MTDSADDLYADDPSHPLPQLETIDITAKRRGAGCDLLIVTARPLQADERSQRRLLRKLEYYLICLHLEEFQAEYGPPALEHTRIRVHLKRGTAPEIEELLGNCVPWAKDNKAALEWEFG